MSLSLGEIIRKNTLYFTRVIALFSSFEIQFVLSEINVEGINNEAVLLQDIVLR